jgi:putative redox protein
MVKCINTDKRYKCIIESSNNKLFSDTTRDKGGSEEGIRPHELLEAALASCLNITIRMTLDNLKIKADNILVKVNLVRKVEGKTIFNYEYNIDAELNNYQKGKIEESVTNCPVKQTLLKEISFNKTN